MISRRGVDDLKPLQLLLDLMSQYRGNNNGDLTCAWGTMYEWGWHSRSTLFRAERELLDTGWIIRTRKGGKNRCNLYALTFFDVDDCFDPQTGLSKLDPHIRVGERYDYWKLGYNPDLVEQDRAA